MAEERDVVVVEGMTGDGIDEGGLEGGGPAAIGDERGLRPSARRGRSRLPRPAGGSPG
jgi:hypothetical protein